MVKCVDCGYLSRQQNPNDEFLEIPNWTRKAGLTERVVCFMDMADFDAECCEEDPRSTDITTIYRRDALRKVVNKDRPCQKFYSYAQGHSPKEHRSLEREEVLLNEQRGWQERMTNEQREWQERMATKQQEWQERMGSRTLHWGLITIGVLLAVATLVAPSWAVLLQALLD